MRMSSNGIRKCAPSEKDISSTRDCPCTVSELGVGSLEFKPAMPRVYVRRLETHRQAQIDPVVASLRRCGIEGQRHAAARDQPAIIQRNGERLAAVAQAQPDAGQ